MLSDREYDTLAYIVDYFLESFISHVLLQSKPHAIFIVMHGQHAFRDHVHPDQHSKTLPADR